MSMEMMSTIEDPLLSTTSHGFFKADDDSVADFYNNEWPFDFQTVGLIKFFCMSVFPFCVTVKCLSTVLPLMHNSAAKHFLMISCENE